MLMFRLRATPAFSLGVIGLISLRAILRRTATHHAWAFPVAVPHIGQTAATALDSAIRKNHADRHPEDDQSKDSRHDANQYQKAYPTHEISFLVKGSREKGVPATVMACPPDSLC